MGEIVIFDLVDTEAGRGRVQGIFSDSPKIYKVVFPDETSIILEENYLKKVHHLEPSKSWMNFLTENTGWR